MIFEVPEGKKVYSGVKRVILAVREGNNWIGAEKSGKSGANGDGGWKTGDAEEE